MKKESFKWMCALFALMLGVSMNAQDYSGNCGENPDGDEPTDAVTWELDGSQLTFKGTGAIKTYSTQQPTEYPWFAHISTIQQVIIGEGITNIPAWAFAMYENLRSISLPSTLKYIGWSCLEETNLWNVSLPEGVETIEAYAFMMTPIKSICIPSTVTEIGERAFGYCEELFTVGCYADEPPTLGDNAFGDSPIETVYVKSAQVTTYQTADGWSDFGDKIQSPSGTCGPEENESDATWSFDMATRTLTIEGTGVFVNNHSWESSGMGGMGGGFNPDNFNGYPMGIYHVVIGEGITEIPAWCFYMELGIIDLTLPSTLTSIGMGAFGECFGLETVTIHATTPPTLGEMIFMDCPNIPTIIVPAEAVETYKAAPGWSDYADKIQADGDVPEPPTTTTIFTYTATDQVKAFDDVENFTGATGMVSHTFADGTGTVVYNGTVTALADGAFYYDWDTKESLSSVTLPESLTALGDDAFRGCTGLATVVFGGTPSLTTINKRAFRDCSALTGIVIPLAVETIGSDAFQGCAALSSVTFEETSSLTTIGTGAFSNCTSLETITLPESVQVMGEVQTAGDRTYYNGSVFSGAGLTSFVVPKNLTTIYGGGHFRNCPIASLTVDADNEKYGDRGCNAIIEKATDKLVVGCVATTVPDGIKTIAGEAFFGEEQPFSLTLPESVTTIEARAFHYATGLTAINIPSGVTEIDGETFAQCGFTELVIPDGVTSIGGMAFMMCMTLEKITLGKGLTQIADWAFECPNMTDIYCYADPTTLTWNGQGFKNDGSTLFHVSDADAWTEVFPDANVTFVGDLQESVVTTTFTYTATEQETRFDKFEKFVGATAVISHDFADGAGTVVYEGTVTEIAGDAFRAVGSANTNLTSITIPESVTSLAANAMRRSTALKEVNFAGTPTLTTIGTYAFADCSSLTGFTVPASVTTIKDHAFDGCSAMTAFEVPVGVTEIGGQAFGNCSELATFTFAEASTLTSIGKSAFYKCAKLTEITFPESLTTLGGELFNGAGVTSIFIPKNVNSIGEGLTYACSVASIAVDAENETYDSRDGCNAVIETATNKLIAGSFNTVIPEGVVTIGTFAFAQFADTFSLVIPESVTTLEFGAIHMCAGLTTVTIPSGITSIDMMTFGGCGCTDAYCYIADPTTLTWEEGGGMAFAWDKATKFHVYDAEAWEAAFPEANVTFVGDLGQEVISVEDITNLIDEYLQPGSTVQITDITDLIDRYLEQ